MPHKRPFIFLNMATSLDGKINTHEDKIVLLGSPHDRKMMHKIRSQAQAVLVGANTVKIGSPPAKISHKKKSLISVVLSKNLDFSPKLPYFQNSSRETLWIFTTPAAPISKLRFWDKKARIFIINAPVPSPLKVTQALYQAGIRRLLIEGGGEVAFSFLKENRIEPLDWYL